MFQHPPPPHVSLSCLIPKIKTKAKVPSHKNGFMGLTKNTKHQNTIKNISSNNISPSSMTKNIIHVCSHPFLSLIFFLATVLASILTLSSSNFSSTNSFIWPVHYFTSDFSPSLGGVSSSSIANKSLISLFTSTTPTLVLEPLTKRMLYGTVCYISRRKKIELFIVSYFPQRMIFDKWPKTKGENNTFSVKGNRILDSIKGSFNSRQSIVFVFF